MDSFKKMYHNDSQVGIIALSVSECVMPAKIESWAFDDWGKMTGVVIKDGATAIPFDWQRYNISLSSVTIPDSVTLIGDSAFDGCTGLARLNSDVDGVFNIPSGVTYISSGAFKECSGLTSVVIPDSVTNTGTYVFAYCSGMTSCTIGSGLTSINSHNFYNCFKLSSCTINSNATIIDDYAFNRCSGLTSIDIPDSVTNIGAYAFYWCSKLTSVDIPSGVTSIGNSALANCSGLTGVTVNATTPPTLGTNAFSNTNNCPIYVPSNKVYTYKNTTGWNTYSSRIQAIP